MVLGTTMLAIVWLQMYDVTQSYNAVVRWGKGVVYCVGHWPHIFVGAGVLWYGPVLVVHGCSAVVVCVES